MLWWGRYSTDYPRNLTLRRAAGELGFATPSFHPVISRLGDVEASLRRLHTPDMIWVPCFRQRDLAGACRWAKRRNVKVVFDPLVSAYLKQVFEKSKFPESSAMAKRLLYHERTLFSMPDMVIADTKCHADAFRDILGVPEERIKTIFVGANEALFFPAPIPERPGGAPLEVLFYGSFIPLHGARAIVDAARLGANENIKWTLIGDGPLKNSCAHAARELGNVVFEPPVKPETLAGKIRSSDILLGVFGDTPQASRVMPNKFFEAIACSRPVITRRSAAYPGAAAESPGVRFVEQNNPQAILDAVLSWRDQKARATAAAAAGELYRGHFSHAVVRSQLEAALEQI